MIGALLFCRRINEYNDGHNDGHPPITLVCHHNATKTLPVVLPVNSCWQFSNNIISGLEYTNTKLGHMREVSQAPRYWPV